MRVLVCGDRHWDQPMVILERLGKLPPDTVVIHGACRGADRFAGEVADALGFEVEEYPAEWDLYGRAAGPIRNRQMLEEGKPDLVLAFHADIGHSRGTKDMVAVAVKAEVPVEVITGPVIREP